MDIKCSHKSFANQGWTCLCTTSNFYKVLSLTHSTLLNGNALPESSKSCVSAHDEAK